MFRGPRLICFTFDESKRVSAMSVVPSISMSEKQHALFIVRSTYVYLLLYNYYVIAY